MLGFETGEKLILLDRDGQVARFFDYRGEGRFSGLETPIADIAREDAVFRVSASRSRRRSDRGTPRRARPLGRPAQKEAKKRLKAAQERMQPLRLELAGLDGNERLGPPLCVVLEGWDASGKGGAIKRLRQARPAPRARQAVLGPDAGRAAPPVAVALLVGAAGLGRDGDPRPLLVRARARRARRGLATEAEWQRAYEEINEFERMLTEEGTVLVKLWLHLSDEEQLERFEARQDDPLKAYKLTDEDWRNRGKRAAYCDAIEEMLERTGTTGRRGTCRGRLQALRP